MNFLKFILCALGHAITFFLYLFFLPEGIQDDTKQNLLTPIFTIATNVFRINLLVYIPFALIVYGLWCAFQFFILHRFKHFTFEQFVEKKFTRLYLILCGLGLINLIFWVIGMEGNAFGFIFALPLMILAVVLSILEVKLFFKRADA